MNELRGVDEGHLSMDYVDIVMKTGNRENDVLIVTWDKRHTVVLLLLVISRPLRFSGRDAHSAA